MKAFVSWSGGKDTSLAFWRAKNLHGLEIKYLLNMISEDGTHSRSHGVKADLMRAQAQALSISIVQRKTGWKNYEEEFKKAVLDFRKEGIQIGVFGDIDLQEHRDWIERVCKDIGIEPILPLWKEERERLLEEFIHAGFKAVVCATHSDFLGENWLGRRIDKKLIEDLGAMENVDLCGEKGEYHTFVYDGPIFKKPVEFTVGKKMLKDKHWFLELLPVHQITTPPVLPLLVLL